MADFKWKTKEELEEEERKQKLLAAMPSSTEILKKEIDALREENELLQGSVIEIAQKLYN